MTNTFDMWQFKILLLMTSHGTADFIIMLLNENHFARFYLLSYLFIHFLFIAIAAESTHFHHGLIKIYNSALVPNDFYLFIFAPFSGSLRCPVKFAFKLEVWTE